MSSLPRLAPPCLKLGLVLGLFAVGCAGPALALGGEGAAEAGQRLESRVVMVLGSRGSACSGTVLSPRVVLTAAHCVSGSSRYAVAYREGDAPVLQEVRDVARHPEFSGRRRVSIDLALVRLRTPLPARFAAAPLDGGEAETGVGARKTIAGFGLSAENAAASAGRLRAARAVVLPRDYPRFMRIGLPSGDLRVCKGDSGGPVFAEGLASLTLTGVVYASERRRGGRLCGDVAQAVRVAPQRGWIDGVLRRWGE